MALLQIFLVFTFVFSAIGPREHAVPAQLIVEPVADELSAVNPGVLALPLNDIHLEISTVHVAIVPLEHAMAMLHSLGVGADVGGAIRPRLPAVSMLLIVLPLTLVPCSIGVCVNTVALRLVIAPIAFVHVTIDVNQSALAVRLVVSELPFVYGSILPDLLTTTFPDLCALPPLTGILQPIIYALLQSVLQLKLLSLIQAV